MPGNKGDAVWRGGWEQRRAGNRQRAKERSGEGSATGTNYPPRRFISLRVRRQMKIPKDNGNTNDWLDTKKNYNWKKRGAPAKKKRWWRERGGRRCARVRGREKKKSGRREREGERTIGNNISIPIEPTHTNATVRWGCLLGGKGRRGSLDRRRRARRGTRAFGKSKKYYTLTYWRHVADETGTDQYQ